MTALRRAYRDVYSKLADASGVAAVEPLRGMHELDAWVLAATGGLPSIAAAATQRLLAAIDLESWPQSQQAIVEAAVTEIRRLGSDAAVRVMLRL
jgi:ActR/RegA family two-component response regulator